MQKRGKRRGKEEKEDLFAKGQGQEQLRDRGTIRGHGHRQVQGRAGIGTGTRIGRR